MPFDWRAHIEPHGADVANAAAISAAAIRELVDAVREIEGRVRTSTALRGDTYETDAIAAARRDAFKRVANGQGGAGGHKAGR